MCLYTPSSCSSVSSSGSSSALSSLLDKGGHSSLLSLPSRTKKSRICQPHDRNNAPKILIEDALEECLCPLQRENCSSCPFLDDTLERLSGRFHGLCNFFHRQHSARSNRKC